MEINPLELFEKIAKSSVENIKNHRLIYSTWNDYYQTFIKTLYMRIQTIDYHEFANSLITATVMFKTEDEKKCYEEKLIRLKKNVMYALELSANPDIDINQALFNVIAYDEAIKDLSEFSQKLDCSNINTK